MRHKIPDDKKREKFTITIDEKLSELMDKALQEKDISNKSKYIERLIEDDLKQKGFNIEKRF